MGLFFSIQKLFPRGRISKDTSILDAIKFSYHFHI